MIRLTVSTPKQRKILHILNYFKAKTTVKQRTTTSPLIVAMVGLVGSGKSTVAQKLAELIGAQIVVSNDFRVLIRARNKRANSPKVEYHEAVPFLLEQMVKWIIGRGGNVILDSDHVEQHKRLPLEQLAHEVGATVIYVRVVCDLGTTIRRINRPYSEGELFADANIALKEMHRRTGYHYYFDGSRFGRWVLRELDFPMIALIDTTDESKWPNQLGQAVERIIKV